MSKVYCENCHYYSCGYSDEYWESCQKAKTRMIDTYLHRYEVYIKPKEKNKTNNCRDFKQLNWKTYAGNRI